MKIDKNGYIMNLYFFFAQYGHKIQTTLCIDGSMFSHRILSFDYMRLRSKEEAIEYFDNLVFLLNHVTEQISKKFFDIYGKEPERYLELIKEIYM